MTSRDDFARLLKILNAAYPMFSLPDESMELYAKELNDVPINELLEAAKRHYHQSRFFPTISELRKDYDERQRVQKKLEEGNKWKLLVAGTGEEVPMPDKFRRQVAALTGKMSMARPSAAEWERKKRKAKKGA